MATDATTEQAPDAYGELLDRYEQIANLRAAGGLLTWDQRVTMPEGGTPARSRQLSALSAVQHEKLTDDRTGDLLDDATAADLDGEQSAVVREIRRQYDRAASVPGDLVEEITRRQSEAQEVWEQAREDDDWDAFVPELERLVELQREKAEHIDPDRDPYEVLFEDYEPYLGVDTAERVLERLRDELVPLVDDIRAAEADLAASPDGPFDTDVQADLCRDILETLGYDFDHGRLDTTTHPFSLGTQYDARVTTRFDEDEPLGGLLSTVHEFGHASYTLGLPRDAYGSPLGESRDMTVHESQSRFWENHVGRTRAFWEHFLPRLHERFPATSDLGVDEVYGAINRVYEDNLIRVEADELTYHMHIVLRFEIERDLVRGDLAVSEVPQVWNEKMEEYLGVVPETDANGCLQDIHWSHGSYGYFPTYSLGSVLAAQLHDAMDDDLGGVAGLVRDGEFGPIHDWLTGAVHGHGCRYTTPELIREATGEDFTADYFLEYAEEKFGDLYGV